MEKTARRRPAPHEQGDAAVVEGVQIEAFCAGLEQWWLLTMRKSCSAPGGDEGDEG